MFGKTLLTVVVIAIVWFGFKYLVRVAEVKRRGESPGPASRPDRAAGIKAETMVECRICGTWQADSTTRACGRADCPY
ncbi:MAG: hypothetical protein Q7R40_07510 [Phaeospirillum sp.]|nr:hypothetical protein [Phaeospirillum sp.]